MEFYRFIKKKATLANRIAEVLLLGLFLFLCLGLTAKNNDSIINIDTLTEYQKIDYYNKIGKDYYDEGELSEALLSFEKALVFAESIHDSLYVAKINSNVGVLHDMLGDYTKAIRHYQKSLVIYNIIDNTNGKESVLNNLGIVYEEMNMPQEALSNYFQALHIAQKQGDTIKIGGTYNNIAIIYENFLDDTDSARYFYNKALKYYIEAGDEAHVALIKNNIGIIYLRKNELENASVFINQSLEMFKNVGTRPQYANALYYKGKLCKEQNKNDEALNYFLQAIELAEQYNAKKLLSNLYHDMAHLYKKLEKYKQSIDYFERYMKIDSELMNFETLRQLHNMEMSFYVEKKEQEIELLQTKAELRLIELRWMRWSLYFSLLIVVLAVVIAILIHKKNLLKQKQELLQLQSRLFRSQTTPHFVFNSLMSIQTLLLDKNIEAASKYLIDFAKFIRSILQNTRNSLVPLDQEIALLKRYLSLEKLRFGDKFDVDFSVNIVAPEEIQFPPMLSQPFIENAIVHGLLPSDKQGLLKVEFTEINNIFFLIIEDNGIGREKAAIKQKSNDYKSMAIEITKQRISIVEKRFKMKIGFELIDLKDEEGNASGTRVVFKVPLD